MKKFRNVVLATMISALFFAGCSNGATSQTVAPSGGTESKEATKESGNEKISFFISKGEIASQLETLAKNYQDKTGVEVEIVVAGAGTSPFETISTMYSSGNPPTLAMLDPMDIETIGPEKALDLSGEKWVAEGGDMVTTIDGKIYAMPFCIEGKGLIYNKTVIEKVLGKPFDPESIKSYDDLKSIFEALRAAGMENPMVLSKEDWSLAGHQLQLVYETQTGTKEGTQAFLEQLKKGEVKLSDNQRFNQLMDTFDLFMEYNVNKSDPLAAVYENDPIFLADGDAAFWFNGNWAWPNLKDAGNDDQEYGMMPYVLGNDKADFVNNELQIFPSKQVMIDKTKSSETQQQEAKDFLNWLVFDADGQKDYVELLGVVPPFKNITLAPIDPLSVSIKKYADADKLFAGAIVPGDHWQLVGAAMQEYLAGKLTRAELASKIEAYWTNQK